MRQGFPVQLNDKLVARGWSLEVIVPRLKPIYLKLSLDGEPFTYRFESMVAVRDFIQDFEDSQEVENLQNLEDVLIFIVTRGPLFTSNGFFLTQKYFLHPKYFHLPLPDRHPYS